jgi:spore germination cell wall hydrolase CwlJ-like protein
MVIDKKSLSPMEALILTVIGEARGEPIEGQVAVAWIIKNRLLHSPSHYKDYDDVVFEPNQFSCWTEELPFLTDIAEKMVINDDKFVDKYLIQCAYVARGVDSNQIIDNTNGSLYYLENDLYNGPHRPKWANTPRNVKVIGNQTFFLV